MTEDELQHQIVAALRLAGCEVLVTSRRRKRCWHCHRWPRGGDGVSKGLPDLFLRRPLWGWMWRAVEVKGDGTRVSPEQRQLADRGAITIARTLDEALAAAGAMTWDAR